MANAASKEEELRSLLEWYQPEILAHTGQSARFEIIQSPAVQLTGGHARGEVLFQVWTGALEAFDLPALLLAGCHELGHILGEITPKMAGEPGREIENDGVEGEADYFAGRCFREAVDSDEASFFYALDSLWRGLYGTPPNPRKAERERYTRGRGINPTYPDADCRALSMLSGFREEPRPACWYNPTKSP
jgi:hypothetical protein